MSDHAVPASPGVAPSDLAPVDVMALATQLHERVVPPLCSVALVLGAAGELDADLRERCRDEVQKALLELRALVLKALDDHETSPAGEVGRWGTDGAPLRVSRLEGAGLPVEVERLTCDVLREAVANALRHASPSEATVALSVSGGRLTMDVVSNGLARRQPARGLGLGLRLAAGAVADHGGSLEWGPELEGGRWRLRLTVPVTSS